MKVNLQKDDLNDKLKAHHAHVRVIEERNDYLVFKFSDEARDAFVFMLSLFLSVVVTPTLFSKLSRSLQDRMLGIFDIFINIFSLPKQDSCITMIFFMGLAILVVSFFIYLFLAKVFHFFFELRFIGDKLIIAKKEGKKEIVLDDDVKFSIEKEGGEYRRPLYKLNVSYSCDYDYKKIVLFTFANRDVAKLLLERINEYLEQNKKYKGLDNSYD